MDHSEIFWVCSIHICATYCSFSMHSDIYVNSYDYLTTIFFKKMQNQNFNMNKLIEISIFSCRTLRNKVAEYEWVHFIKNITLKRRLIQEIHSKM